METGAAGMRVFRDRITDAASFADSVKIPERFIIRANEVHAAGGAVVVSEDEKTFELPVVDMAKLVDPEFSASETAKLGAACRQWGFFQLRNHGLDEVVVQQMKDSIAHFFSLPLESKNAVAVAARGDGFQGFGHHYRRRASDKVDWAECLLLMTRPVQIRDMDLWPANPPTFRQALDEYSVATADLARRLLGFMATDLGVSQEALVGAFFGGDDDVLKAQSTSMHHYPPCRHPELVLGITPHTDPLGLTLLLQVDDTPGLQVKRDGRWFPVRPLPGAIVVNVGDTLDALTNGAYVSAEHRVVPDAERCRTTVAMFHDACVQGLVAPLPELLAGGRAQPRYRPIGKLEYRKGISGALPEGERFLDTLKMM